MLGLAILSSLFISSCPVKIDEKFRLGKNFKQPLVRKDFLKSSAAAIGTAVAAVETANALPGQSISKNDDFSLERIYDTKVGSYLPALPKKLFRKDRLPRSPIICIGEHHPSPLDHHLQFRTISALNEALSEPLAIGLEMFYAVHQDALDRFVFIHGDLKKLADETNWKKTWGYDYNNGYSKIFRYAHFHKLRMVGLNIPQPIVNMVRLNGLKNLPSNIINALPDIDLSVASHFQRFDSQMREMGNVHGTINDETIQNYYEALTLWEEGMAYRASSYVHDFGGKMVVMAGANHLSNRDSMPDRIKKRLNGVSPFTIVPEPVEWDENGLPLISQPPDSDTADWWWYTQMDSYSG